MTSYLFAVRKFGAEKMQPETIRLSAVQKQPFRGFLLKRCSENMQQIYKGTPMPKCNFNKNELQFALRHGCSPINLLHIFRTPFLKNTSEWVLLAIVMFLITE